MKRVFQSLADQMRITEHDIDRRKLFMSFGEEDIVQLKEVSP